MLIFMAKALDTPHRKATHFPTKQLTDLWSDTRKRDVLLVGSCGRQTASNRSSRLRPGKPAFAVCESPS